MTHPVLADPGSVVSDLFGSALPHNSIIDGEMILQYTAAGFYHTAVINKIEELLDELLWIDHVPVFDSEDDVNPYSTHCSITSEYPLIPDDLMLHWNLDGGGTFNDVILTALGGDEYTAEIPAQPYGTTVYYYLSSADTGGRTITDPSDAPAELHSFYVGEDTTPPEIDHEPLTDRSLYMWPSTVSATVTDNLGNDNTVTLEFMINGGPVESVPMTGITVVYEADFFGTLFDGDTVEYRIIAVDASAAAHTTTDPESGYHSFSVVEATPVFIFEPGGAPLSGAAIAQELDALGVVYDMETTVPDNCLLYRSIFMCLGVYSSNHQLTAAEGQVLAEFLDNGGGLYMEGGDTWAYDPTTAVHPYFNINGLADGTGDAGPIQGTVGTFTEGMYFTYGGAGTNSYIDHIAPMGGAQAIFLNVAPAYINGVAYDGGTYRTVGTSFKFAGLQDGPEPSTKNELLVKILEFFEMNPRGILLEDGFESGDTSAWSSTVP